MFGHGEIPSTVCQTNSIYLFLYGSPIVCNNRNDTKSIQLFDELFFSLSLKVSKLEYASAKELYNAMAAFKSKLEEHVDSATTSSHSLQLLSTEDIPVLTRPAKHNEVVAGRVRLDKATGTCPVTHVKLKFVSLEEHQRNELHSDLLVLAKERHAKSPEYKSTESIERAANELGKFSNWLR